MEQAAIFVFLPLIAAIAVWVFVGRKPGTFQLKNFLREDDGQDLVEYALMAGFVAVAAGAIMPGVASSIDLMFQRVNAMLRGDLSPVLIPAPPDGPGWIRLLCVATAVFFLGWIVLRRKKESD